jgi:carbamoyl-phosphate synthase small subunit
MKALLMLENGWYAECESFTGDGEVFGEIVFNTGLTGYQEILTDPSYSGQIVLMTNTMIGNYGIREDENESMRIHAEGFVVREYSGEELDTEATQVHSQGIALPAYRRRELKWASETLHNRIFTSLANYLNIQNVLGVQGVDTRALTKHIREQGAMTAGITTETLDRKSFLQKVRSTPSIVGRNLVREVTVQEPYLYYDGRGPRIIVLDCGVKVSSLRELAQRGCRVEVFPCSFDKGDILEAKPDGILLSNGPGDPAGVPEVVSLVQSLIGEVPIFGICLGQQMIGQALGGKTFKLKFGHHGGNHPVRDERTGKVYITTQNHGFNVDIDTLDMKDIRVSFINLNDHTLEGLKHRKYPLFAVQFHPEAGPGPHDTMFLFDEFIDLIKKG